MNRGADLPAGSDAEAGTGPEAGGACTHSELELIDEAASALRRMRAEGRHTVVAGVLTADGAIVLGLDLVSRMSSACAEPNALANAAMAGHTRLASIVAVCHTPDLADISPISPCGACRERICWHHPRLRVIIPGGSGPRAVKAAELFPLGGLFD